MPRHTLFILYLGHIHLQGKSLMNTKTLCVNRLDLEMPGPVRRRGKHLLEAHRQGLVDAPFIDASASRVLELIHKTGKAQIPDWQEGPEQASDLPEHRAILRRAAAEGEQPPFPSVA